MYFFLVGIWTIIWLVNVIVMYNTKDQNLYLNANINRWAALIMAMLCMVLDYLSRIIKNR